jgi:hypothetical protein
MSVGAPYALTVMRLPADAFVLQRISATGCKGKPSLGAPSGRQSAYSMYSGTAIASNFGNRFEVSLRSKEATDLPILPNTHAMVWN